MNSQTFLGRTELEKKIFLPTKKSKKVEKV